MKISRIYVGTCKKDYHLTQCCVASIRLWYPKIPVFLLKDRQEEYDTSELEKAWDVSVFPGQRRSFGLGWGKLEALTSLPRHRCFIMDSDIVFTGPLFEKLETYDEDFIVVEENHPPDSINSVYFSLPLLKEFDPGFKFPGFVFNTGQLVATTGLLTPEDFAPHCSETLLPYVKRPDLFKAGEQGLLNYLLLKKNGAGTLTLRRNTFMRWGHASDLEPISLIRMLWSSPYHYLLHWAGAKSPDIGQFPRGYLLKFFFLKYHLRVRGGWWKYFVRRHRQRKAARAAHAWSH